MARPLLIPTCLFGLLLLAGGITIIPLVPWLVEQGIRETFKIEGPWSPVYQSFHNSSAKGVENFKSFYFFNVTNAPDVMKGALANVVEVGPYTYREFETYNESWTTWHANGTFSYRSYAVYEFRADQSCKGCSASDRVTIPSMSLLGFFKILRFIRTLPVSQALDYLIQILGDDELEKLLGPQLVKEGLFTTQPVSGLLLGYHDQLMGALNKMQGDSGDMVGMNTDSTPGTYRNETGNDEAWTGGRSSTTLPNPPKNNYRWMTKWHGMEYMPGYWKTDAANKVAGTDATAYHPYLSKNEPKLIWVNSLLRKVNLTYKQDIDVKGVNCWRHIIDPQDLQSATDNPVNDAYYMEYTGWLPAPPIKFGRPINFTKPHYLDAVTEGLVNLATPLVASREDHETYLDIEPRTGSLFQVRKRLQANVILEPMDWLVEDCYMNWTSFPYLHCHLVDAIFNQTKHVKQTYLPVFWLDQHMLLPDSLVDDFKDSVEHPVTYAHAFGGLAVAIGAVLVIASIVVKVLDVRRARRNMNDHEFYRINNPAQQQQQGFLP